MKKLRKWTALFCAGFMAAACLAGCGSGSTENEAEQAGAKKPNTTASNSENAEKSMGRYLEQEITVPEEVLTMCTYPLGYLQRQSSGELVLAEMVAGKYISADNGENWESVGTPWRSIGGKAYIADMALSPDGGAAVVYSSYDEDDMEDENAALSAVAAEEAEGQTAKSEEIAETDEEAGEEQSPPTINWEYAYFDAEGNEIDLEPLSSGSDLYRKFEFDTQGRLYGFGNDHKAYRMDPADGTKKELFETEGSMDFACFTEKYMVGFTTRGEVVIYDLEQEVLAVEDKVLQDFISENLGYAIGSTDRGHAVVATAGEQEDIIYFAFAGGLYRHVIGGTAIEQVIDGATSSFGDPSMYLMNMVMLPDNEFIVLYNDVKLYRYIYDPNVPTVPDQQLKVYSLVENYSMRQAVSLFQKMHQDIYVRYEIGMSGQDGMTREDAIKNLNTKIMSGEGPDILLLDGLPQDSYEEKGILADMSGVIDSLSGEDALFPKIVEACRKDGKIYTLPIRIQIPMIAGSAKYVDKIKDINSLADAVEEIREENPEGAILGLTSEERLLYVLSLTSSAAWMDEKGNIDEKALEEFLTAAERIWQAEIAGLDAEDLQVDRDYTSSFAGEGRYYATLSTNAISIAMKEQQLAIGKVYRVDFDYAMLTSLAELAEDDFSFGFWDGQVSGGFIPDGLAGVAANSVENETAVEFYKFLFDRELQDMDLSGGFPVNMASFDTFSKNPRAGIIAGDESYSGSIGISTKDGGNYFGLEVKWPPAEEFQKLKNMASSVSCISTGDATIEQAVYEVGPEVLSGNMSAKEAVKEVVRRSAIYLAE